MSLQIFIETNHTTLLAMTREKAAKRNSTPRPEALEKKHGVHLFLDQLREALADEVERDPLQRNDADPPTNPDIAKTAALHGHDLLVLGFSIEEVVHDYGDICQAVTELAVELEASISVADFHTMNRLLDNAIAAAVTAWTGDRELLVVAGEHHVYKDARLRRLIGSAITAFDLMRGGKVSAGGATGEVLRHTLEKMRGLIIPAPAARS